MPYSLSGFNAVFSIGQTIEAPWIVGTSGSLRFNDDIELSFGTGNNFRWKFNSGNSKFELTDGINVLLSVEDLGTTGRLLIDDLEIVNAGAGANPSFSSNDANEVVLFDGDLRFDNGAGVDPILQRNASGGLNFTGSTTGVLYKFPDAIKLRFGTDEDWKFGYDNSAQELTIDGSATASGDFVWLLKNRWTIQDSDDSDAILMRLDTSTPNRNLLLGSSADPVDLRLGGGLLFSTGNNIGLLTTDEDLIELADNVVTINGKSLANNSSLVDGITAPSTVAGQAQIYVDTADGDLKVKFGDGFVATLATDS